MAELISLSFRVPKALAQDVGKAARRLGISKSAFARRALEEMNQRTMETRMAELSRRLARESATAAQAMDDSAADGLARE